MRRLWCLTISTQEQVLSLAACRGLGNMPGVLSQPVAMETDRSGEDEDAAQPTYMPIVPAGMSTSAPAPQVTRQCMIFEACPCAVESHSIAVFQVCIA